MLGSLAFLLLALLACMALALGVIAFFAIGAVRDGRRFLNQSGEAIVSNARKSSATAVAKGRDRIARPARDGSAARQTAAGGRADASPTVRGLGPLASDDDAGGTTGALAALSARTKDVTGRLGSALQAGRARAGQAKISLVPGPRPGAAETGSNEPRLPRPVIGKALRPTRPERPTDER